MLEVKPGTERSFENAFNLATNFMQQAEGFLGAELRSCIEQQNKYLVTVSWETVEAHVNGFKYSLFMDTLRKNSLCILEAMYLYILFFLVEFQTTAGSFFKIK